MPSTPRISVVIPVYNTEHYLRECLDSVLGQTLTADQYEVIAVDDGSTDSSPAILREYAAEYPGLRVITTMRSGTAAAPRNTGIEAARGDYVFFVDSDDAIALDTLERLLRVADETGSDVVLPRMENMSGGKRKVAETVFQRERRAEDFVESHAFRTLGPTKLFRRALLEEHQLRFYVGYTNGEDLPFVMGAYLHANHISAIRDKPYYFIRTRTRTRNTSRMGQPPADDLTKNLNVIDVVERHTEPGERRDTLLVRSFLYGPGLTKSFDGRFAALPEPEQRALVERARAGAERLWTERLRAAAAARPWVRAVLDAVFAGDLEDLRTLSALAKAKRPLPLVPDQATGVFRYPGAGDRATDPVPLRLDCALTGIEVTDDAVEIRWRAAAPGVAATPTAATVRWRVRRPPDAEGDEIPDVRVAATIAEFDPTGHTARTRGHARIEVADFSRAGIWDATLELAWGSVVATARLGVREEGAADLRSVDVGVPPAAIVFFTEYANLSLDVGCVGDHPDLVRGLRVVKIVPRGIKTALLLEDSQADRGSQALVIRARCLGRWWRFDRVARPIATTVLLAQVPVPARVLRVETVEGARRREVPIRPDAAWSGARRSGARGSDLPGSDGRESG